MNQINVIFPYRDNGVWMFDDAKVGLVREPFVAGADAAIDALTANIPNAQDGFRLLFSSSSFRGADHCIGWQRHEDGGDIYFLPYPPIELWLCPALLRYFVEAPKRIYLQVEAKK